LQELMKNKLFEIKSDAYNLDTALNHCDELPSPTGSEGCWQGVFMENVNGEMERIVGTDVFNETDPLAPCNKLEEKYQWQCYINHAAYLVRFYNNSLSYAANACLEASPFIPKCFAVLLPII